ncbi:8850_t:CDS:2 [Diversispora eburnea]|uniref:8850_t:CDS:1 n=1 Tax=Diversispora eburnea TaxID=1213867 RepID=A0A9N8VY61_9GLOM|nr:8850_t:CDS:2 [Diversispora eburnea]
MLCLDFPAWLDGLGLKVLTPKFQDKNWETIIETNMDGLKEFDITCREIRKRLAIHFDIVKRALAISRGEQVPPLEKKDPKLISQAKKAFKENSEGPEEIDYEMMNDNSYFLHSITNGLGRFAPLFEDKNWKEIINMKTGDLKRISITDGLVIAKMMKGFKYHYFRAKENNII